MRRRTQMTTALALTALAATAPLATARQASAPPALAPATSACASQTFIQAFLPFGDANLYALAPQGSFEGAVDGWTVTGGATVVTDPGYPGGPAADTASLELTPGARATSPPICANANTPTFRFFVRALSAGSSAYGVDVSYPSATGGTAHGAASLTPGTAWAPTPEIRVKTNKIAVDATGWGVIRITVTAPPDRGVRIDDLYLDPRMR